VTETPGSGEGPAECGAGLEVTLQGGDGFSVLVGTNGDDVIVAGDGLNIIYGLDGDDVICGGPGSDIVVAGRGDDTVFTGAGNDLVYGESGADVIDAGAGDDVVSAGRGDDVVDGGLGFDVVDGGRGFDACDDVEKRRRCELVSFDGDPDPAPDDVVDTSVQSRTYDGLGSLVEVDVDGATNGFVWDHNLAVPQVVEMTDGSGAADVLYGLTRLAELSDTATSVAGYSVLGDSFDLGVGFDPFGSALTDPAEAVGFGFRGELHIDGQVHLRARDLLPELGRFTTIDPLDGVAGTVVETNPYHYVNNDPVNLLDPLGLRPGHGRDAFSDSTFAGYPGFNFNAGYAGLENLNGGGRTLSDDSPRQISISGQLVDSTNGDYACVRYGACTSGASSDLDTALAVASVGPVAGEIIDGYDCVFGGSAWSCAAVFVPFAGGRAVKEGASWLTGLFRSSDEIAGVVPGSSVWSTPPLLRGADIEDAVAAGDYASWYRIGAENNGFFPLFDLQRGNTLVSLKSLDPASPTAISRMQSHILDLERSGATVNGNPANLVLDIRVPVGQEGALASVVDYGATRGVTVQIVGFP